VSPASAHLNRALSDDGRRVFFTSSNRLVPDDQNGTAPDVYEYDTVSKTVSMLSNGRGTAGSYFLDASANGDDVFFLTRERLVTRDVDGAFDVYDARVGGGGFPDPPAPPVPCSGDLCQGPLSTPPLVPPPPSLDFSGPQEAGQPDGSTLVFRAIGLSSRQARAWATSGHVTLRVQISQAGRVSADVWARINGKRRNVASATIAANHGGTVRLGLSLSKTARAVLRHGGTLHASIDVGYSRVSEVQHLRGTLKRRAAI
jgi:hypothetical protein